MELQEMSNVEAVAGVGVVAAGVAGVAGVAMAAGVTEAEEGIKPIELDLEDICNFSSGYFCCLTCS